MMVRTHADGTAVVDFLECFGCRCAVSALEVVADEPVGLEATLLRSVGELLSWLERSMHWCSSDMHECSLRSAAFSGRASCRSDTKILHASRDTTSPFRNAALQS